jgi:thiol-disulfide isomerase/thioredoxin
MKKLLKQIIFGAITILVLILITAIVFKISSKLTLKARIETFPSFSFNALNDSTFSSDQISKGPVVILFFNPECEHCQYQVTSLVENEKVLKAAIILLISDADTNSINDFTRKNGLAEFPGIKLLIDTDYRFIDYFGTESVPTTFIYDKNLKLIRYFKGEVMPETILKYII